MNMQTTEMGDTPVLSVLRAIRRRLGLVLLCLAVVPLAAVVFSLTQRRQYSSSASLLFRDPQFDQRLFGTTYLAPNTDPARAAATNVGLVSLQTVAARTAQRIDHGLTASQVSSKVDVAQQGQADIVSVTATDPDRKFAALLANTFARQYVAFRRDADRSKIRDAQVLLQHQLAALPTAQRSGQEGRDLASRAGQLQILAALQTGNAEVVQPARVSSSPSSPKIARNAGIGAVVGLLLGLTLAVGYDRFDRRLRDSEEVEELFGRPVLAMIPTTKALSASARPTTPEVREGFAMLRANLRYFDVADRDLRSLVVTSATPQDGKTTVASHLAATSARAGTRALLIEADLRASTLARVLDLRPSPGLSEVLSHQAELADAIQHVPVETGLGDGRDGFHLAVLCAGAIPPNPTDLLESSAMQSLIRDAEEQFDFVIVDTPPLLVVPDAIPLVRQVSGVIVVVRLGTTTDTAAKQLKDQLDHLAAPVLGVVVNSVPPQRTFAYGYGYRDEIESARARPRL